MSDEERLARRMGAARKIIVVVSGTPTPIARDDNAPLSSVIGNALAHTGNVGRPYENWELRDEAGNALDATQSIGSFGFPDEVTLFLSLKAGVAGGWTTQAYVTSLGDVSPEGTNHWMVGRQARGGATHGVAVMDRRTSAPELLLTWCGRRMPFSSVHQYYRRGDRYPGDDAQPSCGNCQISGDGMALARLIVLGKAADATRSAHGWDHVVHTEQARRHVRAQPRAAGEQGSPR